MSPKDNANTAARLAAGRQVAAAMNKTVYNADIVSFREKL